MKSFLVSKLLPKRWRVSDKIGLPYLTDGAHRLAWPNISG
jgi:hypothetical protein